MRHEEKMQKAWNFIRNCNITDDAHIAHNSFEDDEKIEMYLVGNLYQVRDSYIKDLENEIDKDESVEEFLNRHNIEWE